MFRKILFRVKPHSSEAVIFRTAGYPFNLYHFLLGHLLPLYQQMEHPAGNAVRVQSFGELDKWLTFIDRKKKLRITTPAIILRDLANNSDKRLLRNLIDLPYLVQFRVHDYWDRFEYFDKRPIPEIAAKLVALANENGSARINSEESIEYLILDRKVNAAAQESPQTRVISNLGELRSSLANLGTSNLIFGPEHEPAEMIRRVNQAKVLIGQTGAGLTHMLWLSPGSLVIELTISPSAKVEVPAWKDCYAALAARLGHRYMRIEVQNSWNEPIDAELVARKINEVQRELIDPFRFDFARFRITLNRERVKKLFVGLSELGIGRN